MRLPETAEDLPLINRQTGSIDSPIESLFTMFLNGHEMDSEHLKQVIHKESLRVRTHSEPEYEF